MREEAWSFLYERNEFRVDVDTRTQMRNAEHNNWMNFLSCTNHKRGFYASRCISFAYTYKGLQDAWSGNHSAGESADLILVLRLLTSSSPIFSISVDHAYSNEKDHSKMATVLSRIDLWMKATFGSDGGRKTLCKAMVTEFILRSYLICRQEGIGDGE